MSFSSTSLHLSAGVSLLHDSTRGQPHVPQMPPGPRTAQHQAAADQTLRQEPLIFLCQQPIAVLRSLQLKTAQADACELHEVPGQLWADIGQSQTQAELFCSQPAQKLEVVHTGKRHALRQGQLQLQLLQRGQPAG